MGVNAHFERPQRPCKLGLVAPQVVEEGLKLVVGRGGSWGGGVSTVLPGPPFLQREKETG